MKRRLLALVVCGLTAASMLTGCGKETAVDNSANTAATEETVKKENVEIMNFTAPQNGDTIIEMKLKDYGTVKFRLFPEYAEQGVENFVKLAESGYYDGLTFHRVISEFMLQGGDPNGNGTGGASTWGGQFDGGTNGHIIHAAGALAYANSGDTSTNGSQFYIVTGSEFNTELLNLLTERDYDITDNEKAVYEKVGGAPYLDGNYTVFGQVFEGLDIIFKLQYAATNSSDKPLSDIIIESMKVSQYNGEELRWYITDYDYENPLDAEPINYTAPEEDEEIVVMNIKDYGTVKFKLFPEILPEACENFKELAKKGYYDGLTFHRIIKDFMVQGGDPNGDGTGGASVWGGEFDGGKYYNLVHTAGALAYANSGSTSTDGSQFYVVTGEVYNDEGIANLEAGGYQFRDSVKKLYTTQGGTPWLDGSYTVFGQVIDGLDVIFKIQNVDTDAENSKPLSEVVIDSVTVEKYDGSEIRWFISDYNDEDEDSEEEETEETSEESEDEAEENSDEAENTENTEDTAEESENDAAEENQENSED